MLVEVELARVDKMVLAVLLDMEIQEVHQLVILAMQVVVVVAVVEVVVDMEVMVIITLIVQMVVIQELKEIVARVVIMHHLVVAEDKEDKITVLLEVMGAVAILEDQEIQDKLVMVLMDIL